MEWYASHDKRVIGMVLRDRTNDDFVVAIPGRDERLRFRAIDLESRRRPSRTGWGGVVVQMKKFLLIALATCIVFDLFVVWMLWD